MSLRPSLVVLTGAGISAESGVPTFRSTDGLWLEHRIEDVATPEGFRRDRGGVNRFYNGLRRKLREVEPNAAHRALARLEASWPGGFLLVTQNVDDLHERAGSTLLVHMHGEMRKVLCIRCRRVHGWEGDVDPDSSCPACRSRGELRPHVVWFGEMPLGMDQIEEALGRCDLFLSIGTSGMVYPAAGFVECVPRRARTVELNLEPTACSDAFREHRLGPATVVVPALVEELLSDPGLPGPMSDLTGPV